MIILILFAGLAVLYFLVKAPQWLANKTGKTVKVRGTFSTLATYEPQNKLKRQLEILQHPLLMSIQHEIEYIQTGKKKILNEYKKLTSLDREKIESAIKLHPENFENFEDFKYYYSRILGGHDSKIRYWHSNNFLLNIKVNSIDFNSFYTLTNDEKQMIQRFISIYTNTNKLIQEERFSKKPD